MVKRQKEKQYQTARENRSNQQLRSTGSSSGIDSSTAPSNRGILPFAHCALTLLPYETPVCNSVGIIFDNAAVMKFILRHKIDPVTGLPADSSKSLIRLNMDQNEEGEWQCPILTKPFTDRSKVVAIIQPGERNEANVYSYEAYYELNVKPRNYEDLLTGNKFDKVKDVLTIFDPTNDELNRIRDINTFYHIRHARELLDLNDESSDKIKHSVTATRVMETLRKKQAKEMEQRLTERKRKADPIAETKLSTVKYFKDGKQLLVLADDVTGVKYTEGQGGAATSLTSTVTNVSDQNLIREATDEEIITAQCNVMRNKLKKKGYVQMITNYGTLTLELHCDIVPRTCMNFLGLCKLGKYNNSPFRRSIPSFMIQGGKSFNTEEEEEECIWGGSFPDEFDDRLKHTGAGVLSMANAGPDTNKQQFFLTFNSCPHLDRKHSVFGNVVDGMDVLQQLERIAVDKKERPCEEIKIIATDVIVDPATEARELEQKRLEKLIAMRQPAKECQRPRDTTTTATVAEKLVVGRYLEQRLKHKNDTVKNNDSTDATVKRLPPPPKNTTFGNFNGW